MDNSNNNNLIRSRFLGNIAKYQPDVLISATTAVLVVHEQEKFEETRLRISIANLKCTTCWVIVLAPSVVTTSKPPVQWHSLKALARFYEKKDHNKDNTRFLLKQRIAYSQKLSRSGVHRQGRCIRRDSSGH
jgi:hypothetical protein